MLQVGDKREAALGPPLSHSCSDSSVYGSAGNAAAGMNCGTDTTKAPDSIAMWRMLATHPSVSSAVGAT